MSVLLVALGGAIGAVLRFFIDAEVKARIAPFVFRLLAGIPVSTLAINVVGSGVLGFVEGAHSHDAIAAFIGTGICGGFTTFSTASVESLMLVRERSIMVAAAYSALTLALCCLACWAGAHFA